MTQPMIQFLDRGRDAIAAETFLPGVRAAEVYAVVSSPSRHHELDGGQNVKHQTSGPEHPQVGESTQQAMRLYGIPYSTTATVVRAEQDRAFAWEMSTRHVWSWEFFEEEQEGRPGVRVRETFDASRARFLGLPVAGIFRADGGFARNRRSIALTLARLHRTFPSA